jgi:small-conductance mechanosensitive channel
VRSFGARLFDVLFAVFSVLFAVLAIVLVFFAVGDWVLLGLVVLILAAAVLTAKDAIPKFVDDARMLLNLGPVREGERITYDGVPWVVEDLTFFTILRNPALRGGMLRMPVARLHDMLSRPMGPNEPFFPCEEGDWVLLDDETYGRSVFQSPEMVQIELLGGAQRTYPTGEFLEQNPRNHSHGFRVSTTFGIDYDHQEQCTGETLEQLRSYFKTAVEEIVPADQLRSLKVEFASASASSLDYDVLLDVTGDLASKFNPLQRALQRIGVDACNKFALVIPFQQVTVHNSNEPRE